MWCKHITRNPYVHTTASVWHPHSTCFSGLVSPEMAEKVLEKLEEQLNCSICLDTYTDPKLLQCFHVYCRQCLVPLVDRDQQGQLGLTCPICRQVTPIPGRVAGLQSAFHINRLLEIKESFQNPAATPEEAEPTDVNPVDKKVSHCIVHEGKELELYCETCGELICTWCALKGGKHQTHHYEKLGITFETYRAEITSFLGPMEKQVIVITKALAQLDARCGEISDQRTATAVNIHTTFRRLREVLDVRETELIGQLDLETQVKLKGLAAQRDQIQTTLAQLHSCLHYMRESLRTGNEGDVLMMKANTLAQVKELTTPIQSDILEPNAKADVRFSASADMPAVCRNYGQVFSPGSPDPSRCHITGKGAEFTVQVGERSAAILHAINFEGKPCEEPIMNSLECEIVSKIADTRTRCSVEGRGQGQYKISYQPTVKGKHQLHIKVQGQHVKGSPFHVAVKSPVKKLGTPIRTIGGVEEPLGVAINHKGDVVVAECWGHCVSVFSPSGEKIRSFGTRGTGPGQFESPRDVAIGIEGDILVADGGNHRIQRFTSGQYSASVGTQGSGHLQFDCPTGITFNARSNKVYVADSCNDRVQVLNSDLTFSSTFGMSGSGKGQFNYPWGIACDSTGKVYVADFNNHHIQVFTAEGKFLRTFGGHGWGRGELYSPTGVAIDTSGMVYVSEGDNCIVSIFTSEGHFVMSFGGWAGWGKGVSGEFVHPRGLAVDDSGVVYVCDMGTNCIQIF